MSLGKLLFPKPFETKASPSSVAWQHLKQFQKGNLCALYEEAMGIPPPTSLPHNSDTHNLVCHAAQMAADEDNYSATLPTSM